MKNKPPYPIASVDHALHLATLLQQEGPLRVSEAADRLGVSPSTAHRLLSMLVYRGFAEQRPDRYYEAGDVLRPAAASRAPVALLREVAVPHLNALMTAVQESVNLVVLAGTEARFVTTAECTQTLRVGSRAGRTLPARLTSCGKAILAAMPPDDVTALYEDADDVELASLRRELTLVRKRGFAINDQSTEAGLVALGVAIRDAKGCPIAGVAIAMPSIRFHRDRIPGWIRALAGCAADIEHDLELQ
ncbi:transcriptional regulator [Lentzea aerocolonigenes]|uniref:Transcriptional regulator n=1 Tax=Lentzea aerocolonigenes TaxID=68170 RepID=A0A0F0GYR8_LENAE|nr:IclR family transcriptional regulator [Lentzea aerocolonigenes]KJK48609.1 transcriptional regulator [Lentzea aerocolonigenes]